MLEQIIVILNRPQKVANIGGAVRAMKNMGLRRLRLVEPPAFDLRDITGIAHRSEDILAGLELLPDLDLALADITFVVGTSARRRGERSPALAAREAAPELLARAVLGPVGLLFGPEDNGLTNAQLDRCHRLVSIPTDPGYPSLNLAQAVLLLAYELRMAAPAAGAAVSAEPSAAAGDLEVMFGALERALRDVQFFKSANAERTMRALRGLLYRAVPDVREAALLTAIAREVSHALRRARAERPAGSGLDRAADPGGQPDRED